VFTFPVYADQPTKSLMCTSHITRVWSGGRKSMVYCTKCGTNNVDGASVCVNCGAPLYGTAEERPYRRYGRHEGEYYYYRRHGGALAGIILGLIIILIGFSFLVQQVYNISIPWWEIILIFFGIYIIARAALWHRRF
jgi:hypothetical protein